MKLVILSRDGVLNEHSEEPIALPEQCIPIQSSLDAIARLCHAGHRVVVAATQTGLESGSLDLDDLIRVHDKLQLCMVSTGGHIDAIFFNSDVGLLGSGPGNDSPIFEDIASRLQIDLEKTPVVTDRLDQALGARAAGARSILLSNHADSSLAGEAALEGIEIYEDLQDFVDLFLVEN